MTNRLCAGVVALLAGGVVAADEGMWRIDQLPLDTIARTHGVRLTPQDLARLQSAPVRILSGGGGGGTGTFASANGLILTNHHVALDCIRTSTLAEQSNDGAENLIEEGFTAQSTVAELSCRRFRAQVERSATDVTAELNAGITPDMDIAAVQKLRQDRRSALERICQQQKGDNFTCDVVDFNSGARSMLIAYEEFKDVRLVYAPEKQLGYFGGDEMNFRFPRYVSDISILRAYRSKDGRNADYDAAHVPARPDHYLKVSMKGVEDKAFSLVAGNPGNTYRYRMSFSADYNLQRGIPRLIEGFEKELEILRRHAAKNPEQEVVLQGQIFSLSNSLKYFQDVLAGLRETNIVSRWQAREREFTAFLESNPALKTEYGDVLAAQAAVYRDDVAANADLDDALQWIQKASTIGYAAALYQFAVERAKTSDVDRDPQYQERRWPEIRQSIADDEPVIAALDEELLTTGFERALALPADRKIPAVEAVKARLGADATPAAMARAVLSGSSVPSPDERKTLVDATAAALEGSNDPAIVFARDLAPSLQALRQRVRVLNEKLFRNRARYARGLADWKGPGMYPDANFTLRVTYGTVGGYTDAEGHAVPFATTFGDMFALAASRGNEGDYALPSRLMAWREKMGDEAFKQKYGSMIVNFVSNHDTTGGNSGSAILDRSLAIIGLIFDGNKETMASDWIYNDTSGRSISTDIRFALTVAREVHGAGWVVDELLDPDKPPSN